MERLEVGTRVQCIASSVTKDGEKYYGLMGVISSYAPQASLFYVTFDGHKIPDLVHERFLCPIAGPHINLAEEL